MFVAKRRAFDHTQPRPSGRVAESGLRHSTRNRAWGNPPWVQIPPLPPVTPFHAALPEKCHKIWLDLGGFCTAYCASAEGPPLLLVVRRNSHVVSRAVRRNSPLIHKTLTKQVPP